MCAMRNRKTQFSIRKTWLKAFIECDKRLIAMEWCAEHNSSEYTHTHKHSAAPERARKWTSLCANRNKIDGKSFVLRASIMVHARTVEICCECVCVCAWADVCSCCRESEHIWALMRARANVFGNCATCLENFSPDRSIKGYFKSRPFAPYILHNTAAEGS